LDRVKLRTYLVYGGSLGILVLVGLGILVSGLDPAAKTAWLLGLVLAATLALVLVLVRRMRYLRLSQAAMKRRYRKLTVRDPGMKLLANMGQVHQDLAGRPLRRLWVFSYTAMDTEYLLLRYRPEELEGTEVRVLVRGQTNGDCDWRVPVNPELREKRKKEIEVHAATLMTHRHFIRMAHQQPNPKPLSSVMRHYDFEPPVRFMMATDREGRVFGYFGFYALVDEGRGKDYNGWNGPVVRVDSSTDYGKGLLRDMEAWFDNYWRLQA
jgi:hypothetical protein